MDLTTYNKFVVNWSLVGTELTLVFKDGTETLTLDTLIIPVTRIRSFLDSLVEVAPVYAPEINNTTDREYCITAFKENKSITEF
jgi:hypothetical protein